MNQKPQHEDQMAAEVTNRILWRLQEESRTWVGEGRDAWTALSRLGGNPLELRDAEIIAKRLYARFPEFKALLKEKGIALGSFCLKAGLGQEGHYSKELHRMLLPPEKSAKDVGLRRSASKYHNLIAAMSSVTNESTSTLANKLLSGTTLHPANAAIRDEVEQVHLMLQSDIDRVDEEFSLFATFKETAYLKAKHAAEGGECRWPQWDASFRSQTAYFVSVELGLIDEKDPEARACAIKEKLAKAEQERKSAMDVIRAYWEQPVSRMEKDFDKWLMTTETGCTASGCLQEDEFFYVPHCHLGYCHDLDTRTDEFAATRELRLAELRENILNIYAQYGNEVIDGWNEKELRPEGQTTSLQHTFGQWHAWIVIYPAPDNKRLMPMFYIPGEEGGAILVPLDPIMLNALRSVFWVNPEGEISSFYDRIKSLIGFRPGEQQQVLNSFRRTASWLRHNPIKKLADQQANDQELMRAYYSRPTQPLTVGVKPPKNKEQNNLKDHRE